MKFEPLVTVSFRDLAWRQIETATRRMEIHSRAKQRPPLFWEAEIGLIKLTCRPERRVAGISDDDVVEDFDFEKLTGSNEVAGNFDVRFRRS